MAKSANDLKKQLRKYMMRRHRADCLEPNGGRRGGIVFYRWFWHSDVMQLIEPNEVADITGLRLTEAIDLLQREQWTGGLSDGVYFLPDLATVAFLEIKTKSDDPSPQQLLFLELARRRGYPAGIVGEDVPGDASRIIEVWQRQRAAVEA